MKSLFLYLLSKNRKCADLNDPPTLIFGGGQERFCDGKRRTSVFSNALGKACFPTLRQMFVRSFIDSFCLRSEHSGTVKKGTPVCVTLVSFRSSRESTGFAGPTFSGTQLAQAQDQ